MCNVRLLPPERRLRHSASDSPPVNPRWPAEAPTDALIRAFSSSVVYLGGASRPGAVQRHSECLKELLTCSFQCFDIAMILCCAGWFAPNKIARQKSIILHGQVRSPLTLN